MLPAAIQAGETEGQMSEPKTYTAEEIKAEYDYRRTEAEGLGRTPERAQAEAEAWKAQFEPIKKDK